MVRKFLREQSGATALEYALIGSLVSIVIIGVLLMMQVQVSDMFNVIRNSVDAALG